MKDMLVQHGHYLFGGKRWISFSIMILLAIMLAAIRVIRYSNIESRLIVPLVSNYVVVNIVPFDEQVWQKRGPFMIVELPTSGRGREEWHEWSLSSDDGPLAWLVAIENPTKYCIPNVEELGMSGSRICGRSSAGYFILDTLRAQLTIFETIERYEDALNEAKMGDVQLKRPADIAASLSRRTTQPWNYTVMQGIFGISDIMWAMLLQNAGIIIAVFIGVAIPRGRGIVSGCVARLLLVICASAIGFVVSIGVGVLAGFDGPPLAAEVVVFTPMLGIIALCIGEVLAWINKGIPLFRPVLSKN